MTRFTDFHRRSLEDRDAFWAEQARLIDWKAPPRAICDDSRPPFTRWMGARPTLPDYLPAIGRSTRAPNLLYAFGHQHLGLTLAATTGEIVAALVADQPAPIDLAPFSLNRFGATR